MRTNISCEFVSSSIPSWQIVTVHVQPFRGARDLAFCLTVPLDSLLVWASSGGSGETARMRRLAWTFAARIGDKYRIRMTRSSLKCNRFFAHNFNLFYFRLTRIYVATNLWSYSTESTIISWAVCVRDGTVFVCVYVTWSLKYSWFNTSYTLSFLQYDSVQIDASNFHHRIWHLISNKTPPRNGGVTFC